MSDTPGTDGGPEFEVTHDESAAETLLVGVSSPGLAGLTAVDYLVDHRSLEQTGHVTVEQFPAITPFENGTPRHHTRLFGAADRDVSVLVGELFVPTTAAGPFSDAIVDWIEDSDVSEVVVLSGIPLPHGPEEHRPFYVATEDFRDERLTGTDVGPMGTGFLDGVNAELMRHGLDTDDLEVAVLVTPVHAQTPDVDAAIRLLDAVAAIYDLDLDTGPLEAFAGEIEQHYRDLSERIAAAEEEQRPGDRMYM
ncbi:MAG: proteasome assembly chaperone family protein [Halobacteriaceae archaeon]